MVIEPNTRLPRIEITRPISSVGTSSPNSVCEGTSQMRLKTPTASATTNAMAGLVARQDLEALDAQALDAVGRRDDAAIERQVVALPRELRLQVTERGFDLPVCIAVESPRHFELAHLRIQPLVVEFELFDLGL